MSCETVAWRLGDEETKRKVTQRPIYHLLGNLKNKKTNTSCLHETEDLIKKI